MGTSFRMDALAVTQPRRLAARTALWTIVVIALATFAYGASLLPGLVAGGPDRVAAGPVPQQGVLALGTTARASFGTLRVLEAHPVAGLTNKQLGSMTHGISGLIGARDAQMEVDVEMTNSTTAPKRWTAADFRLETVDGAHMYAAVGGTRENGTLVPGASVELGLNYVVPRDDAPLVLRVRDGEEFVRVNVGSVGKAPAGTKGLDHDH
jgi:hypothetical protein